MTVRQIKLGWLVMVALLAGCGGTMPLPSAASVLPLAGIVSGWTPTGEAEVLHPGNLFDLVDGQAEAFFAYGFEEVAVGRYQDAQGARLVVEVWQVAEAADAYGLFSGGFCGEAVAVGNGGDSDPGRRLAFWQDRYYVVVRAYNPLPDAEIWAFARAVAGALPSGGEPPALLNRLSPVGLVEHSTIFFHEEISIQNELWLGGQNLLGLNQDTDGVLARYDIGEAAVQLVLVQYPDSGEAEAALENLKTAGVGKLVVADRGGGLLAAVFGDADAETASRLLAEALQR